MKKTNKQIKPCTKVPIIAGGLIGKAGRFQVIGNLSYKSKHTHILKEF